MTKKDKIIKLFNDAEWVDGIGGIRWKIISYDDFSKAGFAPSWEYGEKYNDVIYAKRIIEKLGYSVTIGTNFNVNEK